MTKKHSPRTTESTALEVIAVALPRIEDKLDQTHDELRELNGTIALHEQRFGQLQCEKMATLVGKHQDEIVVLKERVGLQRMAWGKIVTLGLSLLQGVLTAILIAYLITGR